MSDVVLVLSTVPADAAAEALAQTLVEERLAACVNVLAPMTSIYRWKGAVDRSEERQIIIKTTSTMVPALERRLRDLHSYEVPEFVVISTSGGSEEYLDWIGRSVRL